MREKQHQESMVWKPGKEGTLQSFVQVWQEWKVTTGCSNMTGTSHLTRTRVSDMEGKMSDRSGFKRVLTFLLWREQGNKRNGKMHQEKGEKSIFCANVNHPVAGNTWLMSERKWRRLEPCPRMSSYRMGRVVGIQQGVTGQTPLLTSSTKGHLLQKKPPST